MKKQICFNVAELAFTVPGDDNSPEELPTSWDQRTGQVSFSGIVHSSYELPFFSDDRVEFTYTEYVFKDVFGSSVTAVVADTDEPSPGAVLGFVLVLVDRYSNRRLTYRQTQKITKKPQDVIWIPGVMISQTEHKAPVIELSEDENWSLLL